MELIFWTRFTRSQEVSIVTSHSGTHIFFFKPSFCLFFVSFTSRILIPFISCPFAFALCPGNFHPKIK